VEAMIEDLISHGYFLKGVIMEHSILKKENGSIVYFQRL